MPNKILLLAQCCFGHCVVEHVTNPHPRHKLVTLCLAYTGINGDKVKRQLNRLITTCLPWINFHLLFIPTNKLSKLSKLKCILPIKSKIGVVYRLTAQA